MVIDIGSPKMGSRINKIIMAMYLAFLYLNAVFFGVCSCAKSYVLSLLIIIIVLFYPCLQLVYVSLYILLSPCLLITL